MVRLTEDFAAPKAPVPVAAPPVPRPPPVPRVEREEARAAPGPKPMTLPPLAPRAPKYKATVTAKPGQKIKEPTAPQVTAKLVEFAAKKAGGDIAENEVLSDVKRDDWDAYAAAHPLAARFQATAHNIVTSPPNPFVIVGRIAEGAFLAKKDDQNLGKKGLGKPLGAAVIETAGVAIAGTSAGLAEGVVDIYSERARQALDPLREKVREKLDRDARRQEQMEIKEAKTGRPQDPLGRLSMSLPVVPTRDGAEVYLPRVVAGAPVVTPAPVVATAALAAPLAPPGPPRVPQKPKDSGRPKQKKAEVRNDITSGALTNAPFLVNGQGNATDQKGNAPQGELPLDLHAPLPVPVPLKVPEVPKAPPVGDLGGVYTVQPVGVPVPLPSPSTGDSHMSSILGNIGGAIQGGIAKATTAAKMNPAATTAILGGAGGAILGGAAVVVAKKAAKKKSKKAAKKSAPKKTVSKSKAKGAKKSAKAQSKGSKKSKREDRGGVTRGTYRGQKVYKYTGKGPMHGRHYVIRQRKEGKMAKGTWKFIKE